MTTVALILAAAVLVFIGGCLLLASHDTPADSLDDLFTPQPPNLAWNSDDEAALTWLLQDAARNDN